MCYVFQKYCNLLRGRFIVLRVTCAECRTTELEAMEKTLALARLRPCIVFRFYLVTSRMMTYRLNSVKNTLGKWSPGITQSTHNRMLPLRLIELEEIACIIPSGKLFSVPCLILTRAALRSECGQHRCVCRQHGFRVRTPHVIIVEIPFTRKLMFTL